jgi:lycopene beta-cyclase
VPVSYGHFLLIFLVVPIGVLGLLLRRHLTRRDLGAVSLMSLVALVYSTPWDNWIVAQGVWTYDPARVIGVLIGWVPLEEYLFFMLQPVLSGLIVLALLGRMRRTR